MGEIMKSSVDTWAYKNVHILYKFSSSEHQLDEWCQFRIYPRKGCQTLLCQLTDIGISRYTTPVPGKTEASTTMTMTTRLPKHIGGRYRRQSTANDTYWG